MKPVRVGLGALTIKNAKFGGDMIDLHTHTFLSDGELVPSELVQRAKEKGYTAIALTDHVDSSNIERVTKELVKVAGELNRLGTIKVIPGVEITHVPPKGIKVLVKRARELGARLVLVHGETIAEPVIKGTNRAGIEAGVDILAHPGLILPEDVRLAKEMHVYLEISGRKGHCLTNGYVAKMALESGAKLIFSTDAHSEEDLVTDKDRERILYGCGLREVRDVIKNAEEIIEKD